jgi:hypothetical protein
LLIAATVSSLAIAVLSYKTGNVNGACYVLVFLLFVLLATYIVKVFGYLFPMFFLGLIMFDLLGVTKAGFNIPQGDPHVFEQYPELVQFLKNRAPYGRT